jgi:hypothetical protein
MNIAPADDRRLATALEAAMSLPMTGTSLSK